MSTQPAPSLVPPFTRETAAAKVRKAEDNWNSRDPEKVALGYTVDSKWRNRAEFVNGRADIIAFLVTSAALVTPSENGYPLMALDHPGEVTDLPKLRKALTMRAHGLPPRQRGYIINRRHIVNITRCRTGRGLSGDHAPCPGVMHCATPPLRRRWPGWVRQQLVPLPPRRRPPPL